jgi:hypothetical protein
VTASIKITGDEVIRKALADEARKAPKAAGVALYKLATKVMRQSVARTPVLTGELRRSAYVTQPQPGGRPRIELGYGSEHALPVHEEVEVSHDDGEAKFLQRALDANRTTALQEIAAAFNQARKDGGTAPRGEFPNAPHSEGVRHAPGKRSSELRDRIRRRR